MGTKRSCRGCGSYTTLEDLADGTYLCIICGIVVSFDLQGNSKLVGHKNVTKSKVSGASMAQDAIDELLKGMIKK